MKKLLLASIYLISLISLAFMLSNIMPAQALTLFAYVDTNKDSYTYREKINVTGHLSLDGQPIDGLVAVEIRDPRNFPLIARTASIGNTTTTTGIKIKSVVPCDLVGVPKTTFKKGNKAYVDVNVTNESLSDKFVIITVLTCDSDSTPLVNGVNILEATILSGGFVMPRFEIYIDSWVSLGPAKFYANVYSNWPSEGGHPYYPEKTANFTIIPKTGSVASAASTQLSISDTPIIQAHNHYSLSFRLLPESPNGTYVVSASGYAQGYKTVVPMQISITREYQILGDINFDHKIDVLDVVKVTSIYGASSGSIGWNPQIDIQPDAKIDITDLVVVTGKYGTTY